MPVFVLKIIIKQTCKTQITKNLEKFDSLIDLYLKISKKNLYLQ